MDHLISDGELQCDLSGRPIALTGEQALWQRALIRLAVRRGSLPHAPAFGSRLFAVGAANPARREQQALAAVREALAPMSQLRVRAVRCAWDAHAGRLCVRVRLESERELGDLEVRL